MSSIDVARVSRVAAARLQSFPQLPFLTTKETVILFGQETGDALAMLDRVNLEERICAECGGRCCQEMQCAVYASVFGCCPIFEYRPVICRFDFCHRFGLEHRSIAKALVRVALETMAAANCSQSSKAFELNMLLYQKCRRPQDNLPPFIGRLDRLVQEAASSPASRDLVLGRLREEVIRYRLTCTRGRVANYVQ